MSTTITYKGNTLTTVSNATKTLKTAGKYMEDDVQLTDTSSTIVVSETLDTNGGIIKTISTTDEVNLQVKTITPTSSAQTVNPDTGYDGFSQVIVGAGSGGGSQAILQDKSYTVSGAGTATITPDSEYDAMSSVALTVPSAVVRVGLGEEYSTVSGQRKWNASPQSYAETAGWVNSFSPVTDTIVYNAVPANTTITPSTSAQTIGGANYHMEGAVTVAAMPTGAAGTPTATKGTVSNHSISVTPSVTNTTGYITGSTKTGTVVTVSASELVSGSETKTSNGTYDVTNLAELVVNVSGDSPTIQSLSITPSETEQTFNASSVDGYKPVTVSAISSTYVGSGITRQTSSSVEETVKHMLDDEGMVVIPPGYYAETGNIFLGEIDLPNPTINISESGLITASYAIETTGAYVPAGWDGLTHSATQQLTLINLPTSASSSATSGYTSKATIGRSTAAQYINIPPGYNSTGAYYVISAVANGSATAPASISGTAATVSTGTNTLTLTKTVSVTPTVSAGYVSAGTAGNSSVSLTASVTTKAAATITPTTTNQTIAAGTYLTGIQTIAGDADLVGSNILSTANIFGVQGTVDFVDVYIRSAAPTSSVGNDGDIYIQE